MGETQIIDGQAMAARIRTKVRDHICNRMIENNFNPPGLALVLTGNDKHSASYVKRKSKLANECGMAVSTYHMSENTPETELLDVIRTLNDDPKVHGILLQLPLPLGLNEDRLLRAIDPSKDVDGLHPLNVTRLLAGRSEGVKPCTPRGCMELIASVKPDLRGFQAVMLGRSRLVGTPMAQMLSNAGAITTILHSRSKNHAEICRKADILVSATGKSRLVKGNWIKPGAVVIDVGLTWQNNSLVGDVAFDEALGIAGAITPVPGGVGPMTLAILLLNTLELWEKAVKTWTA